MLTGGMMVALSSTVDGEPALEVGGEVDCEVVSVLLASVDVLSVSALTTVLISLTLLVVDSKPSVLLSLVKSDVLLD